jgi:group II intron reverse transcriptase/maturase
MGLLEGKTTGTPIPETSVSTKLQRIAELARETPERAFLSLAHHIDVEFLREAFRRTRKDGAPGVDGQTGDGYEEKLDESLASLLDRFKSGTYKAPPVRRVWIPKGDGKSQRPLGLPTFEDKVLQRAVAMVLEAVYEQDFRDCSHGYRPGRSAHTALAALDKTLMKVKGGWVLELDIQKFFDSISHSQLRTFLDQRVRDGVLRRTIDKWLTAGVLEGLELSHPDAGTPQGGVISPLLANVYLHEVLDRWFERDVKPVLRSAAWLVRFADDAVIVFTDETDANKVMAVLPKRFGKYGLTLHPTKTRLLCFRPPGRDDEPPQPDSRSFDFLGITHFWGKSKRGFWVVKPKTASSRFSRALQRTSEWMRKVMHEPVRWQHQQLVAKLHGHYNYYGIANNWKSLARFRHEVVRLWRARLGRRNRNGPMSWKRYTLFLERYPMPKPHTRPQHSAANP